MTEGLEGNLQRRSGFYAPAICLLSRIKEKRLHKIKMVTFFFLTLQIFFLNREASKLANGILSDFASRFFPQTQFSKIVQASTKTI